MKTTRSDLEEVSEVWERFEFVVLTCVFVTVYFVSLMKSEDIGRELFCKVHFTTRTGKKGFYITRKMQNET